MEILILTEAGKKIGFGHALRCFALAQKLRRSSRVTITRLAINSDVYAQRFLKSIRVKFFAIDWIRRKDLVFEWLKKPSLVIVDSYLAPKSFYRDLYRHKNCLRLAVIDDYNRLDYDADIVINPSVYSVKDIRYKKKAGTTYLAGRDFVIVRKEFSSCGRKKINKEVKDILITLGGKSYRHFVSKLIQLLQPEGYRLHIVGQEAAKNMVKIKSGVKFYSSLNAVRFLSLMKKVDLSISAGGQTSNELAVSGTPTIGICFAGNQILNLKCWQRIGFIENLGWYNQKDISLRLKKAIWKLSPYPERARRAKIGQDNIDGFGLERIEKALLAKDRGDLKLLPAKDDDCLDLWQWRNHYRIRKWCFNPGYIKLQAHKKWFYPKLNQPQTKIFIAKHSNDKVGVIRFEEKPSGITVSVHLNPEYLHKGMGKELISLGTKKFLRSLGEKKEILARIKKDNLASIKAFKAAGYLPKKDYNRNSRILTYVYPTG